LHCNRGQAAGYESRVFEFVSGEHTAKNIMIAAVKRDHGGPPPEVGTAGGEAAARGGKKGRAKVPRLRVNAFGDVEYPDEMSSTDGDGGDGDDGDAVSVPAAAAGLITREDDTEAEAAVAQIQALMAAYGVSRQRLVDLVLGLSAGATAA
jgi:hypothetical protein